MSKTPAPDVAPEASQPAHEAGFSLPADPHAGQGGSYLVNPGTGTRELRERNGQPVTE